MTRLRGLRLGGAVKGRKLLLNDRQTYRVGDCACPRQAYNRVLGEYLRTSRAVPTPESIIVVIATPTATVTLGSETSPIFPSLCHDAQDNPSFNSGAKPTP